MPTTNSHVTAALIKVQRSVKPIAPKGESHHGKFITLKQIYDELKPLWADAGIAVYQKPIGSSSGTCTVQTVICHAESGEELHSEMTVPMQRQNDPQAYGAAMTYGCRYSLKCIFGIVEEGDDDDAASASMSLEKLLRELTAATDLDHLGDIKEAHFNGKYLQDKFWNRVYNLVYQAKADALRGLKTDQ